MPKASLSAGCDASWEVGAVSCPLFHPHGGHHLLVLILYAPTGYLGVLESHGAGHRDPLQVSSVFGDLYCVSCGGVLPDEKPNLAGV